MLFVSESVGRYPTCIRDYVLAEIRESGYIFFDVSAKYRKVAAMRRDRAFTEYRTEHKRQIDAFNENNVVSRIGDCARTRETAEECMR